MVKLGRWGAFLTVLASAAPMHAIVIANPLYDPIVNYGDVVDGINFGGVVEIQSTVGGTTYTCSGSLLTDGVSILTAGHCLLTSTGLATASNVTVSFEGPGGMVSETVSTVKVNPSYIGDSTTGSDLAVLTLSQQAPPFAAEYSLYTGTEPLNTPLVIAGYGLEGTGTSGANSTYGILEAGENEYAGNGQDIFGYSSNLMVGEFYDKDVSSTNVLGCDVLPNPPHRYFNACSNAPPYDASDEVDFAHGDSGGPTFYDGEIVGVHDLGICASSDGSTCLTPPSVNSANNSYFGELFADTSVAGNLAFIEGSMAVPEPGTTAMFGFGLAAVAAAYRRRRKA